MCYTSITTLIAHQSLPYFVVFSFIYNLYWMHTHPLMIHVALLICSLITLIIKELLQIERPCDLGVGHAFPSWHSVTLAFLLVVYAYLFYTHKVWQAWGYWKTSLRFALPIVYIVFVVQSRVNIYTTYWYVAHSVVMGILLAVLFILFTRRYKLENIIKYE